MTWDFADQLKSTTKGDDTTYYAYSGGERVRKVLHGSNGKRQYERIYLGGYELYRTYDTAGTTVQLERKTYHIMDDKRKVALLEVKTIDSATAVANPVTITRYQYTNFIDSASLELDENALIISYEEFHPFGSTAYQLHTNNSQVSLKRYRYVHKERDEETGLYYYGARYHAGWLCRFISVDPLKDQYPHYTTYQYAGNKPITFIDLDGREEGPSEALIATFIKVPFPFSILTKSISVMVSLTSKANAEKVAATINSDNGESAEEVQRQKNGVLFGFGFINAIYASADVEGMLEGQKEAFVKWLDSKPFELNTYSQKSEEDMKNTASGPGGIMLTEMAGGMLQMVQDALKGDPYAQGQATAMVLMMMAGAKKPAAIRARLQKRFKLKPEAFEIPAGESNIRTSAPPPGTRLPRTKGSWSGTPGESVWKSDIPEVNAITEGEGISFENSNPDFSPWSRASFEIEGLTGMNSDFALVHKKMVSEWGFPTQKAAANWLKSNKITLHHKPNGTTIELIPSDLHGNIPHSGGASNLRNQ